VQSKILGGLGVLALQEYDPPERVRKITTALWVHEKTGRGEKGIRQREKEGSGGASSINPSGKGGRNNGRTPQKKDKKTLDQTFRERNSASKELFLVGRYCVGKGSAPP